MSEGAVKRLYRHFHVQTFPCKPNLISNSNGQRNQWLLPKKGASIALFRAFKHNQGLNDDEMSENRHPIKLD